MEFSLIYGHACLLQILFVDPKVKAGLFRMARVDAVVESLVYLNSVLFLLMIVPAQVCLLQAKNVT